MRPIRLIQTGIILLLALAAPVVAVLDEKFWFEKRLALAAAAVVLLALWASRTWRIGRIGLIGHMNQSLGWLVFAAALVVAGLVPAGRIANLMAPDLWAGAGAVLAYFTIRNMLTNSRMIKWGFWATVAGVAAAAALGAGIGRIGPIGPIREQLQQTLQLLQHSPIIGEFREFRVARLGILQVASGLGILGILGALGLIYQLGLAAVKRILKSSGLWEKVPNVLILILLTGFLVLPHPALILFPLAVVAALAGGIGQIDPIGPIGPIRRGVWAVSVGLLVIVILGSSYGLGRVVWGELKFREALAAANRNEGITTYYGLREAIKRNPYEVRYHLLASQIDLALANSIAESATRRVEAKEATPSAGLTEQDRNNILILIQEAVVEGKKAIALDPRNSLLWQNLASIYRALIGVAGGAEDWALKSYQRAAELSPQDPNPPLQLGTIHFISGNYQGAVEAFEKAIKIQPNWPLAHYNLAVVFNSMGEVGKAIEQLQETLELLPAGDPGREQVEKDLAFLEGEIGRIGPIGPIEETGGTEELKEATTSAEVEAPPPPVGPEEATESAEWQEPELEE